MAITVYCGPPGAGKSYAMISQVMIEGIIAGRRCVTNIGGVKPEKVLEYCRRKSPNAQLGQVVLFDGKDALKPGFFPTEEISDDNTFIKGGDLLLFDEWRLSFPSRGKIESADLEPFLRWHRHLVDPQGVACDVVIGTQMLTDVHRDFRGLVERSFKFRKLSAMGLSKSYQWDAYDGSTQPKGEGYAKGNGQYKKEIFSLYKSYDTDADGKELKTDKRTSIWSTSLIAMLIGVVLMMCVAGWGVSKFFFPEAKGAPGQTPVAYGGTVGAVPGVTVQRPASSFRIVGFLNGERGVKVVLADPKGTLRVVGPEGFKFDGDRPVYGLLDGKAVVADDRVDVQPAAPQFGVSM